jgi:hypothetical protein
MVEVKNFFAEVERHEGTRNFKLWRTEHATFWIINSEPKVQSDTAYGRGGKASAPESLLNNSTTSRSRGNSRIAFSSSSGSNGVGSSPTSFLNSA